MMMGVIHEEVGTHRIPYFENVDRDELAFSYKYDVSFSLVALTFLAQSMAAVCNIYVYESWFKQSPEMLALMVPGLVNVTKQDQHTYKNSHQGKTAASHWIKQTILQAYLGIVISLSLCLLSKPTPRMQWLLPWQISMGYPRQTYVLQPPGPVLRFLRSTIDWT